MAIELLNCGVWVVVGDQLRPGWIRERGSLDFDHLLPYLRAIIKPGDTIVDVGANIGDHTVFYREWVGSEGHVIAFEPDPDCYAACVLNCGTFEQIYRAAATDIRRRVGLKIEGNRGQNSINIDGGEIEGFPIDDLNLEQCDLIKIDVEGAELLVLQGAARTIRCTRPKIVCELEESQLERFGTSCSEVRSLLSAWGYIEHDLALNWARDRLFLPG